MLVPCRGWANARLARFFFFSSRRRHTRSLCDWSSDVCSSDLVRSVLLMASLAIWVGTGPAQVTTGQIAGVRSEERRVGKECRSRGSPYHYKKKGDNRSGAVEDNDED